MSDSEQIKMEPFATQIQFTATEVLPFIQWRTYMINFLENLAQQCENLFTPFIGHIKMIALFGDNRYLRVNVVRAGFDADIEGNPPEFFREMKVTLNILVYGITKDAIQGLVSDAVAQLNSRFSGTVCETVFKVL